MAANRRERLIDFVRHAGGYLTEHRQFIRLHQFVLQPMQARLARARSSTSCTSRTLVSLNSRVREST